MWATRPQRPGPPGSNPSRRVVQGRWARQAGQSLGPPLPPSSTVRHGSYPVFDPLAPLGSDRSYQPLLRPAAILPGPRYFSKRSRSILLTRLPRPQGGNGLGTLCDAGSDAVRRSLSGRCATRVLRVEAEPSAAIDPGPIGSRLEQSQKPRSPTCAPRLQWPHYAPAAVSAPETTRPNACAAVDGR